MPLFDPERHEKLSETRWDEAAARAAIARILDDVHSSFSFDGLWPIHPIDVSPERAPILKPIYYGAAGVIWALHHLHDAGFAEMRRDYLPVFETLLARHRADALQLTGAPNLSYQAGEAGILLLNWKLAPSEDIARELETAIAANTEHPALGFLWGGAGSMRAALFMYERTKEERWKNLALRIFDFLWSRWDYVESVGCHLWLTDLYGERGYRTNTLHGFPSIARTMLYAGDLIPAERRAELIKRTRTAISKTALRDGPHANWLHSAGDNLPPTNNILRVQHCVGAPGFVNSFADLPLGEETDALLRAAGQLTWDAGPIAKLPSLCHGAPGSGYAFLKLFTRTGDELWLDRARRFAMHAIAQADRGVAEHGQRKFSLWTGDLGLACYLADCISARSDFPTMDVF